VDGTNHSLCLVLHGSIISSSGDSIKTILNLALVSSDFPRLLVSVRNASEAEAALSGGCDLLDVKEPARGPLGMADPAAVAMVIARVQDVKSPVPVSVALGEALDWDATCPPPRVLARVAYLKLGTAGLGTDADWALPFAQVKQRFAEEGFGIAGERAPEPVKWVAVGYADWQMARGPSPEEVVDGARECGCAGVLIDTYSKETGGLFDRLSLARLESLSARARRNGLEFALAGRLQRADLPRLGHVRPDIVGIRSAACRAGIRTGEIDSSAVRLFREALRATFSGRSLPSRPIHPGGVGSAQRG
jgi:uncharacterized protein (UPF0264 family)